MHVEHDVRLRQVEEVGIALEIARVVAEALAAVLGLVQLVPLEHRPPGAVEHDDALGEQLTQARLGRGMG